MTKTERSPSIGDPPQTTRLLSVDDPPRPWPPHEKVTLAELAAHWHQPLGRVERWIFKEKRIPCIRLTVKSVVVIAQHVYDYEDACLVAARPKPTPGAPKSEEHRRRIAAAQKAAWARRKAEAEAKEDQSATEPAKAPRRRKAKKS